jgi:lipoprotein-releasing system ATP-binding protein
MNDTVLKLSAITKTYKKGQPGEIRVLRGADLHVARGEVVALVAPSGAGKSTLLHIAGLLDTPDTGTVEIAGQAMQGLSDRRRTAVRRDDVGFVYQFHHLLPEFTAMENIALPQLANGVSRAAANARADAHAVQQLARRSSARSPVRRRTAARCVLSGDGQHAASLAGG